MPVLIKTAQPGACCKKYGANCGSCAIASTYSLIKNTKQSYIISVSIILMKRGRNKTFYGRGEKFSIDRWSSQKVTGQFWPICTPPPFPLLSQMFGADTFLKWKCPSCPNAHYWFWNGGDFSHTETLLHSSLPGFIWHLNPRFLLYMRLNISKGTSCRKTGFWVMGMQSQNISKYSPKVDFEISHILESSIL